MRTDSSWAGYLLDTQIQRNPSAFARSGNYKYSTGETLSYGGSGYLWYKYVSSDNNANYLDFGSTFLVPRDAHRKGHGMSLRCLVRQGLGTGNSLPTMVLKAIRTYWLRCMG